MQRARPGAAARGQPARAAASGAVAAAGLRADGEDPGRCPKTWMGKRCRLPAGHSGICRFDAPRGRS